MWLCASNAGGEELNRFVEAYRFMRAKERQAVGRGNDAGFSIMPTFDATWVVPELSDDQGAHFKRGFLGHAFDIAFCGE